MGTAGVPHLAGMAPVRMAKTMRDQGAGRDRRLQPAVLLDPDLPARPARSLLLVLMRSDRLVLDVPLGTYAERHGVSERTFYRFQQGQGRLPAPLRAALELRHPRWKRTLDAVVLEDAAADPA